MVCGRTVSNALTRTAPQNMALRSKCSLIIALTETDFTAAVSEAYFKAYPRREADTPGPFLGQGPPHVSFNVPRQKSSKQSSQLMRTGRIWYGTGRSTLERYFRKLLQ